MRNLIYMFALFCFGFAFSQTIELSSAIVDYGTLKKGDKAEVEVTVTNKGNVPLVISNVKPSCGCTVSTWPKKPILPGKTEKMVLTYDSNKVGAINKVVEIFSNDPNASRKVIRLKGKII